MATISVKLAVIVAGSSVSEVVDLKNVTVVGLVMPTANWRDAIVTVQGSPDGINFFDLYDGVTAKEFAFNAKIGSMVMVNPDRMRSCQAVILRSGTHDAPVVQPATSMFGVVVETTP